MRIRVRAKAPARRSCILGGRFGRFRVIPAELGRARRYSNGPRYLYGRSFSLIMQLCAGVRPS
jgi:hypothetical protein